MWFEHNDMEDLEKLLLEQKEKDKKVFNYVAVNETLTTCHFLL